MIKFHDALQCWRKQPEHSNPNSLLNDLWICTSIPAVLEYPNSQNGRLADKAFVLLQEVLSSLEDEEFALHVTKEYLKFLHIEDVYAKQLVNLTRAMLNGVCAAYHLSDWTPVSNKPLSEDVIHSLKVCFECYHQEWDLLSRPVIEKRDHAGAIPSQDRASAVLDLLSDSFEGEVPAWWTESNWLLVRRLLSYLLGDAELLQIAEENEVQMLVVNSMNEGQLAPVTTTALAEGRPAAYLDPIALGVTLFDYEMLDSLRIAARICRPALSEKSLTALAEKKPEVSVRIGPQPGMRGLALLTGGSAGGITTLAAYATARGQRLNRDHTASFTVTVKHPKSLNDVNNTLSLFDVILGSVDSKSIEIKLDGKLFSTCKPVPLTTVFLHATQISSSSGNEVSWDKWVPLVEQREEIQIKPLLADQTLSAVLHQITGDERIEWDLRRFCAKMVEKWENLTNPQQGEAELEHYISPWFSKLVNPEDKEKKLSDKSERGQIEDHYQPIGSATDPESVKFQALFQPDEQHPSEAHCIVVTEDAGAGKSVFSRALQRWLSTPEEGQRLLYDGKPTLVLRFERGEGEWPAMKSGKSGLKVYLERLQDQVQETLEAEPGRAAEIVKYALKHGRIVFILDAFDQLSGEEEQKQLASFRELVNSLKHHDFKIIVTSRARQVEDYRHPEELFSGKTWRFFRLNGFTPLQQLCYLRESVERLWKFPNEDVRQEWDQFWHQFNQRGERIQTESSDEFENQNNETARNYLRQVFVNVYDDVQELLEVPAILRFVRMLCGETGKFPEFANRADLYFQATDYLFDRNLTKDEKYVHKKDDYTSWFREILAAAAYQMMVMDAQSYFVIKHLFRKLKPQAKFHISNEDILKNWDDLWDGISRVAGLTNFLIVEDSTKNYFGFKHKGMMEFYAGLFLAKNSQKDWETECGVIAEDQTGLIEHSADPNWEWAFRFAMELCEAKHDPARDYPQSSTLIPSLTALFAPKSAQLRPTQLMFRIWQILERNAEREDIKTTRDAVLSSYRWQFREILLEADNSGYPSTRALLAAELVLEDDLKEFVKDARDSKGRELKGIQATLPPQDDFEDSEIEEKRERIQNQLEHLIGLRQDERLAAWIKGLQPKYPAYSLCADKDDADHLTFIAGARDTDIHAYGEEKPWLMVALDSFYMATCCVTREQYQLFDPQLKQEHKDDFKRIAPKVDCPVIDTNWYDGFCFALWLGDQYQLPTEFQWEGAAWGGIDRWAEKHSQTVCSVPPYHDGITTQQVNFDGNHPMSGDKSFYLERTLPVRWTEERRQAELDLKESKEAQLPPNYSPNEFQLWHVNGNVCEWCRSVWNYDLLVDRVMRIYSMATDNKPDREAAIPWAETLQKDDWELLSQQGSLKVEAENVTESSVQCSRSIRGGSWSDNAGSAARTSDRNRFEAGKRFYDIGFRLSRTK